jgi:hypothetical protein
MNEAVLDFPFVQTLPKREKSRVAKLWDHLAEIRAIEREHGRLIPMQFCADLADVSKQRIFTLVEEGRLVRMDVNGHPHITANSFEEWAKSERKAGRPLKVLATKKEIWKASERAAKALVEKVSK